MAHALRTHGRRCEGDAIEPAMHTGHCARTAAHALLRTHCYACTAARPAYALRLHCEAS